MTHIPAVELEAQYDNRANVPEHPEIMDGWERDAAHYRAQRARACELGIPYGAHPRQRLDFFHADAPPAESPIVVFIHGGYWRSLDPSLFSHLAAGANKHGYSVVLPGYRLCPEVTVEEVLGDLRAACIALHRRFGLPLVASGHSAGGHLAAALAATDWRAVPGAPPDLVRSALAVSGIFDLRPLLATSVNETLRLDQTSAEAASPALWHIPADSQIEAWVGGAETAEYHRQARAAADRWRAFGARAQLRTVAGANHFTAPAPLADPGSEMTEALLALCRAKSRTA